jgi:hypothetical protein
MTQAGRQESQAAGGVEATGTQAPPAYVAPGGGGGGSAARSEAGATAGPTSIPATAHIPMAKPVKVQGIVTLILFGLIAAMLGGAILVTVKVIHKTTTEHAATPGGGSSHEQTAGPAPEAPVAGISGPSVAEAIKISPPVVYVIDGGSGMADTYDAAFTLTRNSIKTLAPEQKFSVVVAGESEDAKMGDWIGGGAGGAASAKKFLAAIAAGHGASNLGRAIDAALAMKPSTIVIFCRKAIPDDAAAKAKAGGAKIVGVAMDAGTEAVESLTEAAKQTGGEVKALSGGDVRNVTGDAD